MEMSQNIPRLKRTKFSRVGSEQKGKIFFLTKNKKKKHFGKTKLDKKNKVFFNYVQIQFNFFGGI